MIVSADGNRRDQLLARWLDHDVIVARAPVEVIHHLEVNGPAISTVVLSDVVGSATQAELADFIEQVYPYVRVIAEHHPDEQRERVVESPVAQRTAASAS